MHCEISFVKAYVYTLSSQKVTATLAQRSTMAESSTPEKQQPNDAPPGTEMQKTVASSEKQVDRQSASSPATSQSSSGSNEEGGDEKEAAGYSGGPGSDGLMEPSENVYFWGVPSNFTEFEMNLLVFAAGDVVSVKMGHANGKPNTYAFVQFKKQEDAEAAIKMLHNRKFHSRNLVVQYAKPAKLATSSNIKKNSTSSVSKGAVNTLYLLMLLFPGYIRSGLPENVTDKSLEQLFLKYGTVVSTRVIINRNTGTPLGTALVRMESSHQAAVAIGDLNGCQLNGGGRGHILSCRFAHEKRTPPSSTTNLYISGLPEDVTEGSLKELFAAFGNVVSQKIIINRNTGAPLGTALVRMETNDQANTCISNLHGSKMNGGKFLTVRFAADKGNKHT
eukprot:jgi/Bigna1/87476/estExt_fgenesh1_pg.C_200217